MKHRYGNIEIELPDNNYPSADEVEDAMIDRLEWSGVPATQISELEADPEPFPYNPRREV